MAVDYNRQYVGARYVPTFFNNPNGSWDWATGFQYEPLTIVKYGTGTYTSKQLVPATVGAPNTAPEYWALTGDYNGAINDINESINKLQSDINNINIKRILFIGDSYNTGWPNYNVTPWPELIKADWNISNENFYNFGNPSGGIINSGEFGTYKQMFDNKKSMINTPNTIDIVVITFAYNDLLGDISGFGAGLDSLITDIYSYLPNCKILMACIGCLWGLSVEQLNKLWTIINVLSSCRKAYLLKNTEYFLVNKDTEILDNSRHLTQRGHQVMAALMEDAIITGSANVKKTFYIETNNKWYANVTNGITVISPPYTSTFTATEELNLTPALSKIQDLTFTAFCILSSESNWFISFDALLIYNNVRYAAKIYLGMNSVQIALTNNLTIPVNGSFTVYILNNQALSTLVI